MRLCFLILVCLALFNTAQALETLKLTEKDGQTVVCSIVSYTPPAEAVKIRIAGKYKLVPFPKFTAESQKKINGWLADRKFKSSSGLRIKVEPNITKQEMNTGQHKGEIERVVYVLKLENRAAVDLTDIQVEYQIFYEQEIPGAKTPSQKYRKAGEFQCDLTPKEKRTFKTDMVQVEDRTLSYSGNTYYVYANGASKTSKGRLQGMLLRVTKRSALGKELVREIETGHVPDEKKRGDYQKVY